MLSRVFIESRGIDRPGTVHICAAALPPARAFPSAASVDPAVRLFCSVNPPASVPVADPLSSAAPEPAFSCFPAALPGRAFAPSSATGLELACARTFSGYTFWALFVPGNAQACVRLSPRTRHSALQHTQFSGTCLRNTCLMFVLLVSIFPRSFYFTEYEIHRQLSVTSDSSIITVHFGNQGSMTPKT